MPRKGKRREDVEYIYVVDLIFFEGLDGPTVIRGWLAGTDRGEIEATAECWRELRIKEVEEIENSINVAWFVRWGEIGNLNRPPDLRGVEDIRVFFELRSQQKSLEIDPAIASFEEQMRGFTLEGE